MIDSFLSVVTVIRAVGYDFKGMISKEVKTLLTDSQDRIARSAEQVERSGDSRSLGAPLPRK